MPDTIVLSGGISVCVVGGGERCDKEYSEIQDGECLACGAWTEAALLALLEAGLQSGDVLVRALGHQETAILWRSDPKPMDVLCRYISEKSGCLCISLP